MKARWHLLAFVLVTLTTFVMLNQSVAAELPHDPTACPFLTGKFVFREPGLEDLLLEVASTKNEDGVNVLSMLNESGNTDVIVLDGLLKKTDEESSYKALCSAGTVFILEYRNARLVQTTKNYLNEATNLVMEFIESEGNVATAIGERL